MRRERIDAAIHYQLARLAALLRAVTHFNGSAGWRPLWLQGHRMPTIQSAVRQGYLHAVSEYRWTITAAGRRYLQDLDDEAARRGAAP